MNETKTPGGPRLLVSTGRYRASLFGRGGVLGSCRITVRSGLGVGGRSRVGLRLLRRFFFGFLLRLFGLGFGFGGLGFGRVSLGLGGGSLGGQRVALGLRGLHGVLGLLIQLSILGLFKLLGFLVFFQGFGAQLGRGLLGLLGFFAIRSSLLARAEVRRLRLDQRIFEGQQQVILDLNRIEQLRVFKNLQPVIKSHPLGHGDRHASLQAPAEQINRAAFL